ncbi:MAG: S8 family serine peptidase, partial [Dehalococcoidia bacterium]|nr:S8 family serine peptidase [Dehalococcoidia bacterium]
MTTNKTAPPSSLTSAAIHYPYLLSRWERNKVRAGFPHPNLLPVGEGTADKPCLIDPLQLAGNAKINGEGEGGEVNAAVRLTRLAALVAALLLVVTWSAATVSADSPPPYEPGTVLVRWGPSAGVIALDDTVTSLGAWPVGRIPQLGIVKLRVPPGTEQAAVAALRRAGAQMAGLNHIRQATFTPNDTFYGNQWDLSKINAPSAWDITTGSSNIIVAVVDTGIDTSHPDLPQNLIRGADYIVDPTGSTPVSGDPEGHGTHVSGIIAARMNNGTGVAGVAPGTSLMAVRVLDAKGEGNTYTTALGITYAADHGAKIINLSLSGFDRDSFEEQAVNYAYGKGVLVVAAAGNEYRQG